ncbi:TetR/AcrR family transcriptional regulator [Curvibacter sp. HBC61]|uniref:TetR/AcrR family transcriptional regulator n=1 Tax=Curvibacter cyanobacteriorum TaxID=3026422 RepID=A0ABT5MZ26_9BURK|nr:TetR/AcrR family transcriptional regulator [Curvibacter sp. HBC61]MDD0839328.1 TetR/AcrR family transcriptional regulator [Curvibacter sp. HBC61]
MPVDASSPSQPLAAQATAEAAKGQIRQANESLILEAAERVFAGAGFSGATMAAIAEAAGLPKANLHYYFGNKQDLYRAVLARTLTDWLAPTHGITPEADPATALGDYIRDKMRQSARRPHASKVFANELLHGAPVLKTLLVSDLRALVQAKSAVLDGWVAQGRMAPVDTTHLFFTIWSATQTYADFEVQIAAVLGQESLGEPDYERATRHVIALILRGCGLPVPD